MHGRRQAPGGLQEFMRLGYQDAVLKAFEPQVTQAAAEFPAVLAELRTRLPVTGGPIGVVGASAGALPAQLVIAGGAAPVSTAALISPVIQLAEVVAANERRFGVSYPWSDASRAVAARLDFVARAGEIAARASLTYCSSGMSRTPRPCGASAAAAVRRDRPALYPRGLVPVDAAAHADSEGLADTQAAAMHEPHSGGPVRRRRPRRGAGCRCRMIRRASPGPGGLRSSLPGPSGAAQLACWLSLIWETKFLTAGKARSGRSRKMV